MSFLKKPPFQRALIIDRDIDAAYCWAMVIIFMSLLTLISMNAFGADEACWLPTWYKHCNVQDFSVEKKNDLVFIELNLQNCDEGLSLNLKERIDLDDRKLSADDRKQNDYIWNVTSSELKKKLTLAKSAPSRVSLNGSRRLVDGCELHLFQTAESLILLH